MGRAWPEATQFPEWVLISSSNRLVLGGRTLGLCCALALSAGFPPAGMGAEPFGATQRPQETPRQPFPPIRRLFRDASATASASPSRVARPGQRSGSVLQINAGSAFGDDQIGAAKLASEIAAAAASRRTLRPSRAVESFDDSARAGLRPTRPSIRHGSC